MSLLQEETAWLCTVTANLEDSTEHLKSVEVDGAGACAAKTELSEVNENRPGLEEIRMKDRAALVIPSQDIPRAQEMRMKRSHLPLQDEGACARSVKTEQCGLEERKECQIPVVSARVCSVNGGRDALESVSIRPAEKVTCLCTAKATLHETNEHHKSEETELSEAD
ncbi:NLRC3, partial [Symbiodinium microadriaticum]